MLDKSEYQVVVFVADWCPHCTDMRNHVWTDEKVIESVKSYHGKKPAFITCNKPQNESVARQFSVESYPTVVIMDKDRNIKKRGKNMPAEKLVEFLENL